MQPFMAGQLGRAGGALLDGLTAFKSLYLQCDGADGSTVFSDSSQFGHTVTASGTAQISGTGQALGSGCALFDGTAGRLTVPNSSAFDLGSSDFTIRFYFRRASSSGIQRNILTFGSGSSAAALAFRVYIDSSLIGLEVSDGTTAVIAPTPTNISDGTLRRIICGRNGNTLYAYSDGTASGTVGFSSTVNTTASDLTIGCAPYNSFGVLGRVDELEILKGIWVPP